MNYKNKYTNLLLVNNLYSKYELSRRLNKMIKEDKGKKIKRVMVVQSNNPLHNRKGFFVHSDWLHFLQSKRVKKKSDIQVYFVTLRALNSDYIKPIFYQKFIDELKKLKPTKKIKYVIDKQDTHLHFLIEISKNELVRTIKKIIKTNYFAILKYENLNITKKQNDLFKKSSRNVPVLIVPVDNYRQVYNYMSKNGAILEK